MRTADGRQAGGFSLIELLVVLAVVGLLMMLALPRFDRASEQTRVDRAAGALRTVWIGQRMHWTETKTYAGSLTDLSSDRLTDVMLEDDDGAFTFAIAQADDVGFLAEATRAGSSEWSGTLRIDEIGDLTGSIVNGQGDVVSPATN